MTFDRFLANFFYPNYRSTDIYIIAKVYLTLFNFSDIGQVLVMSPNTLKIENQSFLKFSEHCANLRSFRFRSKVSSSEISICLRLMIFIA
jgi:hypothetical protein